MQAIELQGSFAISVSSMWLKWTEPELMMPWFQPGGMMVSQVMRDLCQDGKFRIRFNAPDGSEQVLFGRYKEVTPEERLTFSWQWQDEDHATEVEVTMSESGSEGCNLTIRHTGFWDQEDRDLHEQAWISCLERLSLVA